MSDDDKVEKGIDASLSSKLDDVLAPCELAELSSDDEVENRATLSDVTTDPGETVAPLHPRKKHMRAEQTNDLAGLANRVQDKLDYPAVAEKPQRHEAPSRKKIPLAAKVLIVLLVAIGLAAAGLAGYMGSVDEAMSMDEGQASELAETLAPAASSSQEAFYVLLIGSDAREGDEASRSDVIMLARVDTASSTVTLVSVPRDTMIYASDGTVEKINAEYNRGPSATVRAVSEFAGVSIAHYVEVDFDGLKEVVDALGGVRVNVPEDLSGIGLSAGEQVLDGEQALAYARERHSASGGDFSRAQAQRQIVEAIINQVLEEPVTELPGLVRQLAASVKTDLASADIATYAIDFWRSESGLSVYSAVAPSYSLTQDGVSYVATMYEEWRAMMQRVDAGLDPNDAEATVPDEQAGNPELGAAANAAGPADYAGLVASAGLTTDDVVPAD